MRLDIEQTIDKFLYKHYQLLARRNMFANKLAKFVYAGEKYIRVGLDEFVANLSELLE